MYKDNFLDKKDFEELQGLLTGHIFPWYLLDGVSYPGDKNIQMIHGFYNHGASGSDFMNQLVPLINKMDIFALLRIKANLLYRTDKVIEHGWHTDINHAKDKPYKTSIFYINTNNGVTKFKTGEVVESVANRLVTFPGNKEHTGTTNTCDEPYRILLNINYV